ncbi:hypothetical protein CDD83_154 [Cordyceps sp. RAO-2017]|nr:hypothetical protein CDD83_154 [Cordyceps sp. RAO-2017]
MVSAQQELSPPKKLLKADYTKTHVETSDQMKMLDAYQEEVAGAPKEAEDIKVRAEQATEKRPERSNTDSEIPGRMAELSHIWVEKGAANMLAHGSSMKAHRKDAREENSKIRGIEKTLIDPSNTGKPGASTQSAEQIAATADKAKLPKDKAPSGPSQTEWLEVTGPPSDPIGPGSGPGDTAQFDSLAADGPGAALPHRQGRRHQDRDACASTGRRVSRRQDALESLAELFRPVLS